VQNREKLMQIGHDRNKKAVCRERGKISFFGRGGEINIIFGPI
jgi:hypothetical protein